ncbi:MAG TPA: cyclic nucleotide-binding domain-containing protein [Candidatus Sulfotelmatobacter sp.]|nr:cyclic nucleotide-binding domain-containing protein [Candidatus Sulfotelmatobacter sp.]
MRSEVEIAGRIDAGAGAHVGFGEPVQLSTTRSRDHGQDERYAYQEMVHRQQLLERTPVFFALEGGTRRALAGRLRRVNVVAGERVVCQGERGDSIFIVESGRCRLVVERSSNLISVAELAAYDFFGEGACVMDRQHEVSVYASTDCTLLALDRTALHSILGDDRTALDELRRVADQRAAMCADMALRASWGMANRGATVVSVYSPKGGSGGTSIALNLVGSLSRRHPGQALLVDLDLPYAHSALLSGLSPTGSIARAGAVPPESFDEVLLSAVLYHPAGPMILAGALQPEEAEEVTPELLARAISVLRQTFRYIVVDLGSALNDVTLATLDETQQVVLVAAPDLSGVKSATDALDILQRIGTPHDAVTLVLNNVGQRSRVDRWDVGQILRRAVDIEVGFDGAKAEQAALSGTILSLSSPRSELARGSEALADLLEARHPRDSSAEHPVSRPEVSSSKEVMRNESD